MFLWRSHSCLIPLATEEILHWMDDGLADNQSKLATSDAPGQLSLGFSLLKVLTKLIWTSHWKAVKLKSISARAHNVCESCWNEVFSNFVLRRDHETWRNPTSGSRHTSAWSISASVATSSRWMFVSHVFAWASVGDICDMLDKPFVTVFRLHRTARSATITSVDLLLSCSLANTTCAIMNIMTTPIFIFVSWLHAFFLVVVVRSEMTREQLCAVRRVVVIRCILCNESGHRRFELVNWSSWIFCSSQCSHVMNTLFMMEFTNSRSKLCEFPLRLFCSARNRRQNLQQKLTTHNSSLASLWNATSLT